MSTLWIAASILSRRGVAMRWRWQLLHLICAFSCSMHADTIETWPSMSGRAVGVGLRPGHPWQVRGDGLERRCCAEICCALNPVAAGSHALPGHARARGVADVDNAKR